MNTLIDLRTLYQLWNDLGDIPVTESGELLDEPFQHFSRGAPVEDVWHWFESKNSRFVVGDVMQGLQLVPLTACTDRAIVLDSNNRQVCVGDEIEATINAGRYGRMRQVKALVTVNHLPDGILDAVSCDKNDRSASGVETICVSSIGEDRVVLGREHHDVEHSYKEVARITRPATAQHQDSEPARSRPKG